MAERPHKKLKVWQKAIDFVEKIYRATEHFPAEERFGLVTQMRRAAVSVATNIAEGAARQTSRETTQFLFISRGSISELDTHLEIASRLGFLDAERMASLASDLSELSAMTNGLISNKRRATFLTHSITSSLTHEP